MPRRARASWKVTSSRQRNTNHSITCTGVTAGSVQNSGVRTEFHRSGIVVVPSQSCPGPAQATGLDQMAVAGTRGVSVDAPGIDASAPPVLITTKTIGSLRSHSSWDKSVVCADGQINFMVQAMEAWFIADPQALRECFDQSFNTNTLPIPQNAESITPENLVAAIVIPIRSNVVVFALAKLNGFPRKRE